MPPKRQQQAKKGGRGKATGSRPVKNHIVTSTAKLPRLKVLPRELMPIVGSRTMGQSLSLLSEFKHIQEYLPALNLLNEETKYLESPILNIEAYNQLTPFYIDISGKHQSNSVSQNIHLFVKRVHLLEPLTYMGGEYTLPVDGVLPQQEKSWQQTLAKINDPYNEAYVDALCAATMSRLVDLKKSPHWCRFYGTFNARADKYQYKTGDISQLRRERWFLRNKQAGLFTIRTVGEDPNQKPLVEIIAEGGDIDCDDLASIGSAVKSELSDCLSESPSTDDETPVKSLAEPPVRISKLDDSDYEDDDDEEEDDDEEDEEDSEDKYSQCEYFAEFPNFPVQVTFHERCEGTMDSLLDVEETTSDPLLIETREQRWSAWIFQVIAALTVGQHYYGFVHNDLHTNNIMWCGTGETHLYYKLIGARGVVKYYKVPTYGRIMKIIDFGRASFWLQDRAKLLITDSYAEGNDADEQYNCEPYYNKNEERVDPNPSFDLCRLTISLFDALYEEAPAPAQPLKGLTVEEGRVTFETESELYNILWMWLTDDEGKNILRDPNEEERFPDFDLYKHIARHAKNCVPSEQAQQPYFEKLFKVEKHHMPKDVEIWELPLQ